MNRGTVHWIEVTVGLFSALGCIAIFFLAMQVSNFTVQLGTKGYLLTARFTNIGSLKVHAPVTLAGVKIGRVEKIFLDPKSYEAKVTLQIESTQIPLPQDTYANIFTSGLLGEQYINLAPGGSPDLLHAGDEIANTQSALVLEQMIGQFLFKKAGENN